MKTTDLGFAFDLICALVFIVTVPLLLMVIFGPAITKGIQQIQDERNGKTKNPEKLSRWRLNLIKLTIKKNKCPRCEFINEPKQEYCRKCGTRLHIT
jgi:hypothetical protein